MKALRMKAIEEVQLEFHAFYGLFYVVWAFAELDCKGLSVVVRENSSRYQNLNQLCIMIELKVKLTIKITIKLLIQAKIPFSWESLFLRPIDLIRCLPSESELCIE